MIYHPSHYITNINKYHPSHYPKTKGRQRNLVTLWKSLLFYLIKHKNDIITLNKDDDFNDIRFSMAAMGVIDIKPNKMKEFYNAYRKFASLLHDKKFIVNFRLKAGDIFSFNNRRVLHGRTSFDPNSGLRHLQGYYLDRDEIVSRLNYLKKIIV